VKPRYEAVRLLKKIIVDGQLVEQANQFRLTPAYYLHLQTHVPGTRAEYSVDTFTAEDSHGNTRVLSFSTRVCLS